MSYIFIYFFEFNLFFYSIVRERKKRQGEEEEHTQVKYDEDRKKRIKVIR